LKQDAKGSVALLTVEGPASRVLANVLAEAGCLDVIVMESPLQPPRLWSASRRLLRYFAGLAGLRSRVAFRTPPERRVESEKLREAQRRVADDYPASYRDWPPGVERIQVGDLNDEQSRSALESRRPDVLAVFRTRILRKHVFDQARIGAVNCHYSLLPEYRGNYVEFWQTLNDDLHTTGVTFHFVDAGVDTGDIIASLGHDDLPSDVSPFELRYRNYRLMLENFPRVLHSVLDGSCERRPQPPSSGRAYRNRDLTSEKRKELYGRLGLLPD
jgi:hypothetical protein